MSNRSKLTEKEYLINLAKKYYGQGDDYFAFKSKKGNWHFGYSNDAPMQHGQGDKMILPEKMVQILMQENQASQKLESVSEEEIEATISASSEFTYEHHHPNGSIETRPIENIEDIIHGAIWLLTHLKESP